MNKIKTKRIKSKKEKMLIKFDIVFIIICLIIARMNMDVSIIGTVSQYFNIYNGNFFACINIILAILWMLIIIILNKCFVLIAIYLAYRISRMKVIKENSKYEVIDNIEYYRERFKDITPTEISLITDLEIETKKDISASILDLYQKGIVDFDKNIIIVKNEENILRQSQRQLVNMLKNNDFSKESISNFERCCIKEAKENNYIKEKVNKDSKPNFTKNNKLISISTMAFIISLIMACIFIISPSGEKWFKNMERFDKYLEDGKTEIQIIQDNEEAKELYIKIISESGPIILLSTIFIVTFFILIGTPIYRKTRRKIYNKVEANNRYERTKESKILVEQIAGMKNYIHDFSLLSEKDKEYVMLWEEFLIYAVVLEENETIIKDICNYKNINLNKFNDILNFKNLI